MKRRILQRNPPDAWAAWVGPNMDPYQNVGVLGDATDIWTETDMERAFHDVAQDAVHRGGAYRGVPLNVQRTNVMFYDIELVEAAGVGVLALCGLFGYRTWRNGARSGDAETAGNGPAPYCRKPIRRRRRETGDGRRRKRRTASSSA